MKIKLIFILLIASFSTSALGHPNARELMRQSEQRLRAPSEILYYRMLLIENEKVVHNRELVHQEKKMQGKHSTLVRFTEPAAVRHASLLIEDHGDPINLIWSYIPSTRSLRQLAGSQKKNWFMGTEFTYEDFEDYKLEAYGFSFLFEKSPCEKWEKCFVIEAKPKVKDEIEASGYSAKHYFIEENTLFPVKINYIDKSGKAAKSLVAESLTQCGNYTRAKNQTMINLQEPRKTKLELVECNSTDPDLKDSDFSLRALRTTDY